jgi:hypothetical protein
MTADLIALAREAGFDLPPFYDNVDGDNYQTPRYVLPGKLQAFADLIRQKEREECAKVCDELAELNRTSPTNSMWQWAECAAAIRARGTGDSLSPTGGAT